MSYRIYILHSVALDRFYIGFTERGGRRLKEHRQRHKGWTGQAADWNEVFSCRVETQTEARALEKQLKARGAKRYLAAQQNRKK